MNKKCPHGYPIENNTPIKRTIQRFDCCKICTINKGLNQLKEETRIESITKKELEYLTYLLSKI